MTTPICPDWSDDGPETRGAEFLAAVRVVYREVEKHAAATGFDVDLPRRWHRAIFSEFVPLGYYAGNFRQVNFNWPCLDTEVRVGAVAGSPAANVIADMEEMSRRIRVQMFRVEAAWGRMTRVQKVQTIAFYTAQLVGRFIQIHPFRNGNGRVSRLLWFWSLRRFGYPAQVPIPARPAQPYGRIMAQCMEGNHHWLAVVILQHLASRVPVREYGTES